MDQKRTDTPLGAPTRRNVIKTGTTAALAFTAAPMAFAGTAPQLPRHASREIILEFNVTAGTGSGSSSASGSTAARPLGRP